MAQQMLLWLASLLELMAMDDFETFTRERLVRMRAEIEALERVLKEFQATKARQSAATKRGGDNPRSGAFGAVMDAIAASGPGGLNLNQMVEAAANAGYEVKRPTLRAQVWKAKEEGTLTQLEPGRYRSSVHDAFADVQLEEWEKPQAAPSAQSDLDDEIPF